MAHSAISASSTPSISHASGRMSRSETRALEMGPGRGAWTRTLLPAREVVVIDAAPGRRKRILGIRWAAGRSVAPSWTVPSTTGDLPEAHFDYVFSFGCLCHLSPAKIDEYLGLLAPKLRPGAHCFLMYADYAKANAAKAGWERLTYARVLHGRRALPARIALRLSGAAAVRRYPVLSEL